MKNRKILGLLLIAVISFVFVFLNIQNSFSIYKSTKNVTVNAASGNIICDAEIIEDETFISKNGNKYFKVRVKNYDNENNISKAPVEYNLHITNQNGSSGEFMITDFGGVSSTFSSNSVTSNYKFTTTTKQNYDFIIEVKEGNVNGDLINYSISLNCYQIPKTKDLIITYNSNGGSECNPKSIEKDFNETYGTLCIPSKTNYEFAGWFNESTFENKIESTNLVTNESFPVLYAKWNKTELMHAEEYPSTNSLFLDNSFDIKRSDIESVEFVDSIVGHGIFDNNCWDVSSDKSERILAWYTDTDDDGLYEITIGQNGGVKANEESDYLLSYLINASSISLANLITTNVSSFDFMFYNSSALTSLSIDMPKIGESEFNGCNKLSNITISNNVTSIGNNAFYYTGAGKLSTQLTSTNPVALNYNWESDNRKFADTTPPTISNVSATSDRNGKITVTTVASDDDSGIKRIEYSLDNINWQTSNIFNVSNSGTYTVYVRVTDNENNVASSSTSVVVTIKYTVTYKWGFITIAEEEVEAGTTIQLPTNNYSNISSHITTNVSNGGTSHYFGVVNSESQDNAYEQYNEAFGFGTNDIVYWCFDKELTSKANQSQTITSDITFYSATIIHFGCPDGIYMCSGYFNVLFFFENDLNSYNLTFVDLSAREAGGNNIFGNNSAFTTSLDGIRGYMFDTSFEDSISYYESGAKVYATFQNTNGENLTYTYFIANDYQPCLLADTEIEVEEEDKKGKKKRRRKKIQDITYDDDLVVWDFDNGCESIAKPIWIMETKTTEEYCNIKFEDGTELNVVTAHRIFNLDSNKFTYLNDDKLTPIGTRVFKSDGTITRIVEKKIIRKVSKYHNIVTERHLNLFANGILTSCRLNNMYEIKDMKFVKDGRMLRDRSEFVGIDDKYIDGLRLLEQPDEDINRMNAVNHGETLRDYVIQNFLNHKK